MHAVRRPRTDSVKRVMLGSGSLINPPWWRENEREGERKNRRPLVDRALLVREGNAKRIGENGGKKQNSGKGLSRVTWPGPDP